MACSGMRSDAMATDKRTDGRTQTPAASPPDALDRELKPVSPGFRIPNTQVFLPPHASAGSIVEGRAPAGSRIEAAGQTLTASEDGRFQLQVPADARGRLPVRIERPGRTALVLQLEIVGR
jgi:hypothetical protein